MPPRRKARGRDAVTYVIRNTLTSRATSVASQSPSATASAIGCNPLSAVMSTENSINLVSDQSMESL